MANKFQNPWDVGGEYYNQNALHTEFLPKDAAYFTGVNPNTGEQAGASSNNTITKCGEEYIAVTNKNKDNVSAVSWGETSGLYPVKNSNLKYSELINIDNWDCDILKQLMKARAGITLVADRNGKHHTAKVNLNNAIEKKLAPFHLKNNFPSVDSAIDSDSAVKYFFLSDKPNSDAPSSMISPKYWNQVRVATYGPFYAIGGGDAGKGMIYIHFYKAVAK